MALKPLTEDARHAGLRLAVSVFVATVLGYGLALPLLPTHGFSIATADATAACFKWAAMTCIVVATPNVAKVGQTAGERVLGTIVGGAAGFGAYSFAHSLDRSPGTEIEDGVLLAATAALVAYATYAVGAMAGLQYSSKLCAQSFVIVAFGASAREVSSEGAFVLALSRVAGIVTGVMLIEVASVVLWPRAATTQALGELKKALDAATEMADAAWRAALEWAPPQPVEGGAAAAASGDSTTPLLRRSTDEEAAPDPKDDTATADALSAASARVTAALDAAVALAATTHSEVYVEVPCTTPRRACFLPGTPWGPAGPHGRPLDRALLADAVAAARSAARALAALHASRPRSAAYAGLLAVTYPPNLLRGAANDARFVLASVAASSPGSPPGAARAAAQRVRARAAALLRISDYAKRALHRTAMRGVRSGSLESAGGGGGGGIKAASPESDGGVSPSAALEEMESDLAAVLESLDGAVPAADDGESDAGTPAARKRARLESLARASSLQIVASAFPPTGDGFLAHVRWLGFQVALDDLGTSLADLVAATTALAASLPAPLRPRAAYIG